MQRLREKRGLRGRSEAGIRVMKGGGGVHFRASHGFSRAGCQPCPACAISPGYLQLASFVLSLWICLGCRGPIAPPTQCHSAPWRPRGSRCHATRWVPSCYSPHLSAPLTRLDSERRGESEGGLSGQRQTLHPGYSLAFLQTAKGR